MKKKIAILGSTGSIGKQTLKIIKKDKKNFDVVLLSTNRNTKLILEQAKEFNVKNSPKIEAEYFSLHCSVGRNQTSNICSVTNAAAYKQSHHGLDNELTL